MAQYAPGRVHALIIGGRAPSPGSREALVSVLQRLQQGSKAILAIWDTPVSPALEARLLANDVEALMADRTKKVESPGFAEILPTMTMPCLLFVGEEDRAYPQAKAAATHLPRATFFSLPGLRHAEIFFRSDLVLPRVLQFLATVTR